MKILSTLITLSVVAFSSVIMTSPDIIPVLPYVPAPIEFNYTIQGQTTTYGSGVGNALTHSTQVANDISAAINAVPEDHVVTGSAETGTTVSNQIVDGVYTDVVIIKTTWEVYVKIPIDTPVIPVPPAAPFPPPINDPNFDPLDPTTWWIPVETSGPIGP